MFSEDDRCAIGMSSASRAKRRTSPQIPRRSSAIGSCGTDIPHLLEVEKLVPTENRVRPARPQWGRPSSAAGPDVHSPRMSRTSSRQAPRLASAAVNVALNLRQCLPQIVPLDKSPPRPVEANVRRALDRGARHAGSRSPSYFRPGVHLRSTAPTVGVKTATATPAKAEVAMPGEPARPSG